MLTLSASQISTYRDECKRKWALKSIAKIPTETHPSAALGTEVDNEQLQPYLKDGRGFDYTRDSGYIAASALAFLPQPKTYNLEVQKHFTFRSPTQEGLGYQGYIDLWMPEGGMPIPEGLEPVTTVCDFKTTGNLKWQKSPKTLATDVQAMMYATYAMVATPSRIVDLVWIYMQTKGTRKAKRTHLRVIGSHVQQQFLEIDAIGREMMKARQEVEALGLPLEEAALTLPANPEACEGYGGCPFRSRCNLSPAAFKTQLPELETTDMSDTAALLAQLKAKRSGLTGAPITNADFPHGANAAPVVAVGINPPEKDLPLPVVVAPVVVEAQVSLPVVEEKPGLAKTKGRPKKDPLGADVAAYTLDEAQRHQRIGALVIELASLLGVA